MTNEIEHYMKQCSQLRADLATANGLLADAPSHADLDAAVHQIHGLETKVATLTGERDAARAALRPFAQIVEHDSFRWREMWQKTFTCIINVSDIEQAAALGDVAEEERDEKAD